MVRAICLFVTAAACTSGALQRQPGISQGDLAANGGSRPGRANLTVLVSDSLDDPTDWTVDGGAWSHVPSTGPAAPGGKAWYARDRSFVDGGAIGSYPVGSRLSSPFYQVPSLPPCVSDQEWRDNMGHGCDTPGTPMDAEWCAVYGHEQSVLEGSGLEMSSGNEACCQCGGGAEYKLYFSFWIKNTVQWPRCELFSDFPAFYLDNYYIVS